MLEHFGESRAIEILYEDFGCYFDDSLVFTNEFNKKVINNYEDVINLIAMKHASIQEIEYLLNEMNFWHLQNEPVADVVVDEDKIKREGLTLKNNLDKNTHKKIDEKLFYKTNNSLDSFNHNEVI